MLAVQGPVQDPGFVVLVILVVTVAVVFWRTAIKLLAIGVILLVILGLYECFRVMH